MPFALVWILSDAHLNTRVQSRVVYFEGLRTTVKCKVKENKLVYDRHIIKSAVTKCDFMLNPSEIFWEIM